MPRQALDYLREPDLLTTYLRAWSQTEALADQHPLTICPHLGRLGHLRIMDAASDDDTMLDAERKASPFCAGRAIVVNEPEESAGRDGVG